MKPYRSSTFFSDGLSSRPLVEGTVPRGFLKTDTEYFTGKKAGRGTTAAAPTVPSGPQPSTAPSTSATASTVAVPTGAAAYPDDVEVFPIPVTKEMVIRGKERYEIFCSACHGLTGDGDGMIVRRGFRRAASFNDDRLRQAPVGHFFDAITNGWGAMPSYAPQIPVQDRWAIIAYIRALQLKNETADPNSNFTRVQHRLLRKEGGTSEGNFLQSAGRIEALPTNSVFRWWALHSNFDGGLSLGSRAVFPFIPFCFQFLGGNFGGIAGVVDVAAFVRRRLGPGDSSRVGSGDANRSLDGAALRSHHLRRSLDL